MSRKIFSCRNEVKAAAALMGPPPRPAPRGAAAGEWKGFTASRRGLARVRVGGARVVWAVSRSDLPFLHAEIERERVYHAAPGFEVQAGDVVVDVGANVGLFAVAAGERCWPGGGTVVAVEPLPPLASAAHFNLEDAAARHARATGQPADFRVVNAGASDGAADEATFALYTAASGWSTMHRNEAEVERAMEQYLARATAPGAAAGPRPRSLRAAALLRRVLPVPVYSRLLLPAQRLAVKAMLRRRREVRCPLVTVSQVIQVRRSPPSAGKAPRGGRARRTDARPGPGPGFAPGRLPEGRRRARRAGSAEGGVRPRLVADRKGRLRGPRHRRGLGAGAGSAAGHGPVRARPRRAGRRAARDGALQRVRARMILIF